MSFTDRDHAMHLIELADKTLGEVRPHLYGASPKVTELFGVVAQRVNDARNMALSAPRDFSRLLDDNRIYPAGRYEDASKAVAEAEAKVDALKQAGVAALTATKLLEEEAMPRFEGDAAQEAMLRDEVRDILSRSTDHTATLARLAHRARFAGLVVSEFGRSLLEERGLDQRQVENSYQLVRAEALAEVIKTGTDAQKRAVERIELGEKMQGAVLSAAIGAKGKLEPLAARVKALGDKLTYDEARRVREAGRAR